MLTQEQAVEVMEECGLDGSEIANVLSLIAEHVDQDEYKQFLNKAASDFNNVVVA